MKPIKLEIPQFYNVTCLQAPTKFNQLKTAKYIYQFTFRGMILSMPVEDNGLNIITDSKYVKWGLN